MKDVRHIIKHVETGVLKAPHGSSKKDREVELYRLDFSSTKLSLEEYPTAIKDQKNKDGNSVIHVGSKHDLKRNLAFSYSLPPQYEKMVDEVLFAIPRHALNTVSYLLIEAFKHWENPFYKGYDTMIREGLLKISETCIDRAFYLLFDYLYDPETQYYRKRRDHEIDNDTLRDLALYNFWKGRTGRGLQAYKAGFGGYNSTKGKYLNEEDIKLRRDNNKTRFYVAQEIKEYERLQGDYINKLNYELNFKPSQEKVDLLDVPDTPLNEGDVPEGESIGQVSSGIIKPKKGKSLHLYEVVVNHTEKQIKDNKIEVIACGGSSVKVVAEDKNQALIMVKNYVENEYPKPEDYYVFRDYEINELEMDGLKPDKEGIVITMQYKV